jgi:flagellar biogenesis protein FliO
MRIVLGVMMALFVAFCLKATIVIADEQQQVVEKNVQAKELDKPAWAKSWKTQTEPVQEAGYSMLLGLLFCLAVLSFGIWACKRLGWIKPNLTRGNLKVIERTALSAKTSLCLVEAGGKRILVSVGSERVSVISRVGDSLEANESFEELVCNHTDQLSAC